LRRTLEGDGKKQGRGGILIGGRGEKCRHRGSGVLIEQGGKDEVLEGNEEGSGGGEREREH